MTTDPEYPQYGQAAERARTAAAMNALAHPSRVLIFRALRAADRGLTYGELLARTGLTIATLNHHLGMMRAGRAVAKRRKGAHVFYRLRNEALAPYFARMADEIRTG